MKKGQKKRSFDEILQTIDREEFIRLHNDPNYTQKDLMKLFSIGESTYRKLQQLFGLETRRSVQSFEKWLTSHKIDEVIEYYKTHSRTETQKQFNLTPANFNRLVKAYDIVKTSDEIKYINQRKRDEESEEDKRARIQKGQQTMLERYGVDSGFSLPQTQQRHKEAVIEKYGSLEDYYRMCGTKGGKAPRNPEVGHFWLNADGTVKQSVLDQYGSLEAYHSERMRNTWKTKIEKYGDAYYTNPDKIKQTNIERYGTYYSPQLTEPHFNIHGSDSKPNLAFKQRLIEAGISVVDEENRELYLNHYKYDFHFDKTLIEINPTATHNSTWSPFGDHRGLDKKYHYEKVKVARDAGYRCLCVWDWDNEDAIIKLLTPQQKIQGRKCQIKEVSLEEATSFINQYHIQRYAKDQIRIGLYFEDQLVSIMTFDKPRYNSKYQYELIRYCSNAKVIGGAEKLFHYFVKTYDPISIVSYCDWSKFNGNTYEKLGFTFKRYSIGKHWYNIHSGQHITDNLLRQRGFDQLFGTDYGKGTSNTQLMLDAGFVEVYDAGQAAYTWMRVVKPSFLLDNICGG